MRRTPAEIAVVMRDGTARIVDVGAPAVLVWLSDTYPDADVAAGPTLGSYAMTARLVHHVVDAERPFEDWLADVEMLVDKDDVVDEIRGEIAQANGSPTQAAAEEALPTAAETRTPV